MAPAPSSTAIAPKHGGLRLEKTGGLEPRNLDHEGPGGFRKVWRVDPGDVGPPSQAAA
jgi:hypothetical protein